MNNNPDEAQIRDIVKNVLDNIKSNRSPEPRLTADRQYREGAFMTVREAVDAAGTALRSLDQIPVASREKIIIDIRKAFVEHSREFANEIFEETGLGRVDDKIEKIKLAALKTPGTEDLKTVAVSGDNGLCIAERGPYGVIGAILPVTNPVETIINNGISMLAGGNAVVFNPHPGAKRVSAAAVEFLNKIVTDNDGPANVFTCLAEPTIESARELMHSPDIRIIVVTGGPGVVKEALKSGKKAVCAGPGNPPVVVDEGVDLKHAAENIVFGSSFDNNIICCQEKEVFVVASVYEAFIRAMKEQPVVLLNSYQEKKLMKTVFDGDRPRKEFIGKNASVLLKEVGIEVDDDIRLAICEVSADHPLVVHEQMMPFLPIVKAGNVDEAIMMAKEAEDGRGHSSYMYSLNVSHLHQMARIMNTAIFVKNGPSPAGLGYGSEMHTSWTIAGTTGEGLTTARDFTRERNCILKGYFRIV